MKNVSRPTKTLKGEKVKKTIFVEHAVKPIGPYSHAVEANGFIYLSGQGPANPVTGQIPHSFEDQVKQVMINIETILKSCGIGFENIVKMNVYLSDLSLFEKFNAVYKTYFAVYKTYFGNDFPARTTIGANLLGIMIEIDCIAVK